MCFLDFRSKTLLGSNHFNIILTVKAGPLSGSTLVVPVGEIRTVGRTSSSFFVTDDSYMTGVHFELQNFGDHAEIRDNKSRNKTWLNNVSIAEANLKSGDSIRAGKTEFLVQLEELPLERPEPEVPIIGPIDSSFSSPIGSSFGVLATIEPAVQMPKEPVWEERVESQVQDKMPSISTPFESVDHSFLPKQTVEDVNDSHCAPPEKPFEGSFGSPFDSIFESNVPPISDNHEGENHFRAIEPSVSNSLSIRRLRQQKFRSFDFDFWDIMVGLSKTEQIKIVAHFRKLGLDTPEELQGLTVYPQQPVSVSFLPVIIDKEAWISNNMQSVSNRLLRADGIMMAILGNSEVGSGALQDLSTREAKGFSEANGFLPWYWPSQLHSICESLSDSEVGLLLQDSIKGFVYAVPQLEFTLHACVDSALEPVLAEYGFE